MPVTDVLSRAQLATELLRLIEDRLEGQNTAERLRTVLLQRDNAFYSKKDDKIPVAAISGLLSPVSNKLLIGLLPPPNLRPGGPFHVDHWLIDQEEANRPSSVERIPPALLCIGAQITVRLGDEAGRYEVVSDSDPDEVLPLLVEPDGNFRGILAEFVPGKVVRLVSGGGGTIQTPSNVAKDSITIPVPQDGAQTIPFPDPSYTGGLVEINDAGFPSDQRRSLKGLYTVTSTGWVFEELAGLKTGGVLHISPLTAGGTGGGSYDDTQVRALITALQNNKLEAYKTGQPAKAAVIYLGTGFNGLAFYQPKNDIGTSNSITSQLFNFIAGVNSAAIQSALAAAPNPSAQNRVALLSDIGLSGYLRKGTSTEDANIIVGPADNGCDIAELVSNSLILGGYNNLISSLEEPAGQFGSPRGDSNTIVGGADNSITGGNVVRISDGQVCQVTRSREVVLDSCGGCTLTNCRSVRLVDCTDLVLSGRSNETYIRNVLQVEGTGNSAPFEFTAEGIPGESYGPLPLAAKSLRGVDVELANPPVDEWEVLPFTGTMIQLAADGYSFVMNPNYRGRSMELAAGDIIRGICFGTGSTSGGGETQWANAEVAVMAPGQSNESGFSPEADMLPEDRVSDPRIGIYRSSTGQVEQYEIGVNDQGIMAGIVDGYGRGVGADPFFAGEWLKDPANAGKTLIFVKPEQEGEVSTNGAGIGEWNFMLKQTFFQDWQNFTAWMTSRGYPTPVAKWAFVGPAEHDSWANNTDFLAQYTALMNEFKAQGVFNANTRFTVPMLQRDPNAWPNDAMINTARTQWAAAQPYGRILAIASPSFYDGTHFTTASQKERGKLWYKNRLAITGTANPTGAPVISNISPAHAYPGQTVMLTGFDLANATVLVGGMTATVTSSSANNLSFVVPQITEDSFVQATNPSGTGTSTNKLLLDFYDDFEGPNGPVNIGFVQQQNFAIEDGELVGTGTGLYLPMTLPQNRAFANARVVKEVTLLNDGKVHGIAARDDGNGNYYLIYFTDNAGGMNINIFRMVNNSPTDIQNTASILLTQGGGEFQLVVVANGAKLTATVVNSNGEAVGIDIIDPLASYPTGTYGVGPISQGARVNSLLIEHI